MKNKDIYKANINFGKEAAFTWIGIGITISASILLIHDIWKIICHAFFENRYGVIFEQILFSTIVFILISGNLLYQFTRIAYMKRLAKHQPMPASELNFFSQDSPTLAILIPSYKEESRVIKQSLLSSALQSYPKRRVVLLVDDPPRPKTADDFEKLSASRLLPQEIQNLLQTEVAQYQKALNDFVARRKDTINLQEEHILLMNQYQNVIDWFKKEAQNYASDDHTDQLFIEITFEKRICEYEIKIQNLLNVLQQKSGFLSEKEILREYHRLAALFQVEVTSFERKVFENLSHESNKAMNLNSYIGLMGGAFKEIDRNDSVHLEPSDDPSAKRYADTDYLITLDADSLLDSDYALRLIHFMEQPENQKIAVVQTPYSAVPNPPGILERVAGATTDMQYLIHQGFTGYNATFWVGANALLRKRALDDIRILEKERGFTIVKFIQDRTVIEDTESSVDLINQGWQLHNFPERLSYSATPPDFGSLIIQRQRWANGGLIIFPKLIRYLKKTRFQCLKKIEEAFMRSHYLTSITGVNIGMSILLIYPFEHNMRCFWLPLTALPYYFFYGRDLLQAGYKLMDLFRVYVINLLLIPVNLSGVFKSIRQAMTGKKIPFKRTPKVSGKTGAPPAYVASECFILVYCFIGFLSDALFHYWLHAFFSLAMSLCFLYAVSKFIGFDEIRPIFSKKKRPSLQKIRVPIPHTFEARTLAKTKT